MSFMTPFVVITRLIRTSCIILWTYSFILSESPVWPAPHLGSISERLAFIAYNDTHNTHTHTRISLHTGSRWPLWLLADFHAGSDGGHCPYMCSLFGIKHVGLDVTFPYIEVQFKMQDIVSTCGRWSLDSTCSLFDLVCGKFPFFIGCIQEKHYTTKTQRKVLIHMLLLYEMKFELWTSVFHFITFSSQSAGSLPAKVAAIKSTLQQQLVYKRNHNKTHNKSHVYFYDRKTSFA